MFISGVTSYVMHGVLNEGGAASCLYDGWMKRVTIEQTDLESNTCALRAKFLIAKGNEMRILELSSRYSTHKQNTRTLQVETIKRCSTAPVHAACVG